MLSCRPAWSADSLRSAARPWRRGLPGASQRQRGPGRGPCPGWRPGTDPPSPARSACRAGLAGQIPSAVAWRAGGHDRGHDGRLAWRDGTKCANAGVIAGDGVASGSAGRHEVGDGGTVAYGDGANLIGPGPANLRPGQSGWVMLAYADACPALTSGGRADYRTLFMAVGHGRVRIDFPAALNLVCGLLASTFGAPAAPPPAATSPLNVLAATVRLPAAVTAGTTASYLVTLHNTSGTRLVLFPCPSYTQYLVIDAGHRRTVVVEQRFYLNCAAVRQIPAHSSVTFAMRVAVPAAQGRAKYDWQLQDADVATAGVVVVRRSSQPESAPRQMRR
jgi:hypothetical protein